MGLYDRIKEVCKERNVSINRLEKELDLPRSSVCKYNANTPSVDRIKKIAYYLGVSVDYLTTGKKENEEHYYINEETREIAQEIYENRDLKALFDIARDTPPEKLKAYANFLKELHENDKQ